MHCITRPSIRALAKKKFWALKTRRVKSKYTARAAVQCGHHLPPFLQKWSYLYTIKLSLLMDFMPFEKIIVKAFKKHVADRSIAIPLLKKPTLDHSWTKNSTVIKYKRWVFDGVMREFRILRKLVYWLCPTQWHVFLK